MEEGIGVHFGMECVVQIGEEVLVRKLVGCTFSTPTRSLARRGAASYQVDLNCDESPMAVGRSEQPGGAGWRAGR